MPRKIKHQPDPALKDLPIYIRQVPNNPNWFYNGKTQEKIHVSKIMEFVPLKPDPTITEKRWDLNY